jgi:hypothetical protein
VVGLNLAGGEALSVSVYQYFDGTPSWSDYCRYNSSHDQSICYQFENRSYSVSIRDAATNQWKKVWDSTAKSQTTTDPAL